MHNVMTQHEREKARPMEQTAKKIYALIGGKYGP
jgi:hypothetical protein